MPSPSSSRAWGYALAAVGCLGLAFFLRPASPPADSPAKLPEKSAALSRAALPGTVSAPAPEVIPPKPSETVAAIQKMREKDPAFIARRRVLDARVAQGDAVVGELKASCLAKPHDEALVVDAVQALNRIGTPQAKQALQEICQKCPVASTALVMLRKNP